VTGNPVRSSISGSTVSKSDALRFFNLTPAKKTVLATGGSLGAKGINEAIAGSVDEFDRAGVQLIWQTGKPFLPTAKQATEGKNNIWTNDFISQMEYAYAAADVVISRAGAMAIAELSVLKKPVIFVPYPFAAEDHQTANAKTLESKNAGVMISDNDAKGKLVTAAISLAMDDQKQDVLKTEIGKLGITDADKRIADEVLRNLGK